MPYFLVENFKAGLDVRKSALTAPAGTLTIMDNAAISPGGEIVKRRAFVKVATLTNTFGLAAIGTTLVAFTRQQPWSAPTIAGLTDVTLRYDVIPNTSPTATLVDYDVFDGKLYVVMHDPNPQPPANPPSGPTLPAGIPDGTTCLQTSDNTIYVWQKDRWNEWAATKRVGSLPARGYTDDKFFCTTNRTGYTVRGGDWVKDSSVTGGTSGAFLPSNQMEGAIYFNYNENQNYITKNRFWEPYTPDRTAATLPTGYPDGSAFKNTTDGKTYKWQTSAWVEWKITIKEQNPHYYYDDRDKVNDQFVQNVDLTWEWTTKNNPKKNTYQLTEGAGMGYYVRAYKSKLYCVGDKYLRFSAVNNAFLWEVATDTNDNSRDGAGYVNVSVQEGGSSTLQGVEIYYDKLALFSELSTQMWNVVSDPKQNALGQVLRQTGTKSPWSVQQYGSGDILFLASSGIRSLKARDISNSAAVSDIGSPIDDLVRAIPDTDKVVCRSVLEPVVGRVWFAFRRKIFVLSFFPGPNITAWSTYTTEFDIDYIVACGDRVFIRSGDDLYLFGGVDGKTYDDCPVEVRLPFLDGSKPGHMKMYQAIDATVTGTWDIKIAYDFDNPTAEETVAVVTAPTWNKGRYELTGYASHMSLRFYSNTTGPAIISNAAIHYNMSTDAD